MKRMTQINKTTIRKRCGKTLKTNNKQKPKTMTTKNNANHMLDNNGNVEKFKIEFYHSDGFGQISNESECVTDINGLKERFGDEIFGYIQNWLKGESFKVVEKISKDEFLLIKTATDGSLLVMFRERYRAGGYDDDPVYRYNDDVYLITLNNASSSLITSALH